VSTPFIRARHAESTWNAQRRWQGQADPPLSERGLEQARALARALADEPLEALFASDLRRARRTAEIVGEAVGLAPVVHAGLRELDVGRWEGRTRADIASDDAAALARFDSGDPDATAGGGESRRGLERRVRAAFAALAAAHPGARIGVVTHLGVIRALLPDSEPVNAGLVRVRADALGLPAVEAADPEAHADGPRSARERR